MKRLLLLCLGVIGLACQAQPPQPPQLVPEDQPSAPGPIETQSPALRVPAEIKQWTIERTFKREARGPSSGYTITLHSDGSGLLDYWASGSNRNFKPKNQHKKIQISAQQIASLTQALKDPELAQQPAGGSDSSNGRLTVTLNGASGTFRSDEDTYSGAAGRLASALSKVKPWPTR